MWKFESTLILLLVGICACAQNKGGFYCDTTVFVSTYSLPCLGGSLVVSCDNGILYCINNENTKEGSILLGCFDEKTNSSSASLLKFPRHHAKLGNLSLFPLQGFVLHSEKLYLSQQGVLYCFEKDSNRSEGVV